MTLLNDGWLWTGQQWRLLFSEEPGKVSQEPKRGAEEHLHRRRRSAGVRCHWLKEEGPGAGDQPQLPRSRGRRRPPAALGFPCLEGSDIGTPPTCQCFRREFIIEAGRPEESQTCCAGEMLLLDS